MSDMPSTRLPKLPVVSLLGLLLATMAGQGCVREVLSGEDPQAKPGRLTGRDSKDQLVVRIPWMETPTPRLLSQDVALPAETVFTRTPGSALRFSLRAPNGATAVVDARTKRLADDSMEFTYEIVSLPAGYSLDTGVRVLAEGIKPAIDLRVNGAPVKLAPGTEVAFVQLARDSATRITAIPKQEPAAEAVSQQPAAPRKNP